MYITILGRQPELGIAELERIFDGKAISITSPQTATVEADFFDVQRFGGVPKAGKIVEEITASNWRQASQKIVQLFYDKW